MDFEALKLRAVQKPLKDRIIDFKKRYKKQDYCKTSNTEPTAAQSPTERSVAQI